MKIIKKGTKITPDEKVYIRKCRVCGCKFTYMEKDMHRTITNPMTNYEYVVCPQCSYLQFIVWKKRYKGKELKNNGKSDKKVQRKVVKSEKQSKNL